MAEHWRLSKRFLQNALTQVIVCPGLRRANVRKGSTCINTSLILVCVRLSSQYYAFIAVNNREKPNAYGFASRELALSVLAHALALPVDATSARLSLQVTGFFAPPITR